MENETFNISRWWPDEPIPVYHSKDKLEPKHIWISSADIYNDTYNWLMKNYIKQLDDKINEVLSRDLSTKVPIYYATITEDGLTPTIDDEIVDKFNAIGCTSFMLMPEEVKQLLEKNDKENKQCST